MNSNPTDISPCGDPECSRSSSKLLKFTKLSEEKQQVDHPSSVMDARRCLELKTDGKTFKSMCLPKLRRSSVCSTSGSRTSIASTFLATHASTNNASCIIDPLKVLSQSPLNALLGRRDSQEDVSIHEASYLAEALRNFDKQTWAADVDPTTTTTSPTPLQLPKVASTQSSQAESPTVPVKDIPSGTNAATVTASQVETRTVSSSYISAHEDYDDQYHEVSDVEAEVDHDAEAYPVPDHYVTEAKSKDSFLNVLYDEALAKKPTPKPSGRLQSNSDLSNDSIQQESGYKSNNSSFTTHEQSVRQSEDSLGALARCVDIASSTPTRLSTSLVKSSITDVYPVCRSYVTASPASGAEIVATSSAEDSSEQISKLIVDLIGPNSRVGKLIFQSCSTGQDVSCIYDEIKQCVQAELQMEDKLASFFRKQSSATVGVASVAAGSIVKTESLRHIDDTLVFVKEHLTQIRADLNEFKENSYKKIDSKVSYTEFSDTTAILRAKMTYLERKLFNEHRIMRQDIRNFREKINFLENEAACGLKNFPVWPFLAFIGAYSIINLGRR